MPSVKVKAEQPVAVEEETGVPVVEEAPTPTPPAQPEVEEMPRWERREREANSAFINAQSKMGNVGKDAKGNYGKFVSLPKLLEAVVPALNGCDLFLSQSTANRNGDEIVITRIKHANGMTVAESEYPVSTADKTNPQKMGSGLTYARRYALMSLVGIGAEDDEGEAAKVPGTRVAPATATAKSQLMTKLKSMGIDSAEKFQKVAKEAGIPATRSTELTEEQSALWLAKLSDATPF